MWELFDGDGFEEVYLTSGEWDVSTGKHRLKIRIVADRNNKHYYSISANHNERAPMQVSRRGYQSAEQALEQAVREIKLQYK
ncbi:hypothetical protein EV210_11230 [Anaerospora hongkongensis]|uniref:DUF1508 domain-containing protein n=1 Tax=Anaerospora hongkongensis TaxID=244830 RepID=A0A4R1PU10_9FIRM|nr:hypothetical protein [Anaerospora hongkongensis]TCL35372.1 hypothetical protein EV210_11230 [Anaerospora hongkongensis]